MSYLGIILGSVFSANALLSYGLGACPVFRRERKGVWTQLIALGFVSLVASVLFWTLRRFALAPLGLQALDVIAFAVLIVPLLKYLSRFVAAGGGQAFLRIGAAMDEAVTSCLVFGIALIVTRSDYGLLEAFLASLASCFGWWLALVALDSVRERLELSCLPASFRGAPALLLSAGLMAMAFMGLDHALIRNLAR